MTIAVAGGRAPGVGPAAERPAVTAASHPGALAPAGGLEHLWFRTHACAAWIPSCWTGWTLRDVTYRRDRDGRVLEQDAGGWWAGRVRRVG